MKTPHCPFCKHSLTVFWDSFKMWNLVSLKCPYCRARLRTPKSLTLATLLSIIYGYGIGAGALFIAAETQSLVWLYAVITAGVGLLVIISVRIWNQLTFQPKHRG